MATACFDQLEGCLNIAELLRLQALAAARQHSCGSYAHQDARGEPLPPGFQGHNQPLVPPRIVCRARGEGVPIGSTCRVARQGDLLLIGCLRTGKLTGVRMLKGATVVLRDLTVVDVSAACAPHLSMRLETPEEAEKWAEELRSASCWPPRAAGQGDSQQPTPRQPPSALTVEPPTSSRQLAMSSQVKPSAGSPASDPSTEAPEGDAWGVKAKSEESSNGEVSQAESHQERQYFADFYEESTEQEKVDDESEDYGDNSSDLEGWVEAQTRRSTELMQLFEQEMHWMEMAAGELADRRNEADREAECIDALEEEQASHQQGLCLLESMVDALSAQCQPGENPDGPQYFYIGDEASPPKRPPKLPAATRSPRSAGAAETPGTPSKRGIRSQQELSSPSARRDGIQKELKSAEDAWEARRRVLQEQAEAKSMLRRRGGLAEAKPAAVPKSPKRRVRPPLQLLRSHRPREQLPSLLQQQQLIQQREEQRRLQEEEAARRLEQQLSDLERHGRTSFRIDTPCASDENLDREEAAEHSALATEDEAWAAQKLEVCFEAAFEGVAADSAVEAAAEVAADEPAAAEAAEHAAVADAAEEAAAATSAKEAAAAEVAEEAAADATEDADCAASAASEAGDSTMATPAEEQASAVVEASAVATAALAAEEAAAGATDSEAEETSEEAQLSPRLQESEKQQLAKILTQRLIQQQHDLQSSNASDDKASPASPPRRLSEEDIQGKSPEVAHFVIPQQTPLAPIEDSELQVVLERRRQQVEQSADQFTKEGGHSAADVSWDR
eukprot:gb/GFBE01066272.1/.p1 GENE.gb/GFBE01066272.1/~~gb/GFBE01066272.1/.p1  ORF type:complete len:788 (+),score=196.85 gb/GFBE01066272.1/:1-2364(+)